ncbi:MAG TPA: hypothetical protein VF409_07640, partial [Sphingomonas sp.]
LLIPASWPGLAWHIMKAGLRQPVFPHMKILYTSKMMLGDWEGGAGRYDQDRQASRARHTFSDLDHA